MNKLLSCRALCAGLAVAVLSTSAFAAAPMSTGLGQAWPNTSDMSASSRWHVYVFQSHGVRFVQVNDLGGRVRGAFAAAHGQILVLPMGSDARRIATPQQPLRLAGAVVPLTRYAQTIYRDRTVQVSATPLSDGTTMFSVINALPKTPRAADTTPCTNPVECNGHVN